MGFLVRDLMEWLAKNKEWIFSGIGVFIVGLIWSFCKSRTHTKQSQSVKNSSNVIQVGGNVIIEKSNDRTKR